TGADSGGVSALNLQDVSANQDVGLDATGGGSVTATTLTAGRDAAVRSTSSTIGLTSVAAGDDVVLRGAGAVTVTGALTSGQDQRGEAFDDGSGGQGDVLAANTTLTLF